MSSAAFVFLDRVLSWKAPQDAVTIASRHHEIAGTNSYVRRRLAALRGAGHTVVLVSSHAERVVQPLAFALGAREVLSTRLVSEDDHSSGRNAASTKNAAEQLSAIKEWAQSHRVSLERSVAVTDSMVGVSLLNAVGQGVVVNPDTALRVMALAKRWKVEFWDRPEGVGSVFGREPATIATALLMPQLVPGARFTFRGLELLPDEGPAILAANHRSLYDAVALAVLAKRVHRPVRVMAKAELLAVPLLGPALASLGVIGVDRQTNPREAYRAARAVLAAGEILVIMPEGTIPPAAISVDSTLAFKTGAARLAARSGAPLIPVAISGADAVWPSGSTVPNLSALVRRPRVRIELGAALVPTGSVVKDAELLRASIIAMLKSSATMDAGNTAGEDAP